MDRDEVIIVGDVRLAGQRAVMAVTKQLFWFCLENDTLVFILLALEFTLPYYLAALAPARFYVGTEHVLFDRDRINECVPNLFFV